MRYKVIYDRYRGWKVYTSPRNEVDRGMRNTIISRIYCRLNGISISEIERHNILVILKNKNEYIVDIYDTIDDAICSTLSFVLQDQKMHSLFDFSLLNSKGERKGDRLEWEWERGEYYVCISTVY